MYRRIFKLIVTHFGKFIGKLPTHEPLELDDANNPKVIEPVRVQTVKRSQIDVQMCVVASLAPLDSASSYNAYFTLHCCIPYGEETIDGVEINTCYLEFPSIDRF